MEPSLISNNYVLSQKLSGYDERFFTKGIKELFFQACFTFEKRTVMWA